MAIGRAVLIAAILGIFQATAAQTLVSRFDFDREGWSGIRSETPFVGGRTAGVVYHPAGGNPNGQISIQDDPTPPPTIFAFSAPGRFLGDQSHRYGQVIRWDHRYNYDGAFVPPNLTLPDIGLVSTNFGTNFLIVGAAGVPATNRNVWAHFEIGLTETNGWHVGTLTNRAPTEAEFRAALAGLHRLYLNGEYIGNLDTGFIDNVEIGPAIAPRLSIAVAEIRLCWQSETNEIYRTQFRDPGSNQGWADVGPALAGTGEVLCADRDIRANTHRAHRVIRTGIATTRNGFDSDREGWGGARVLSALTSYVPPNSTVTPTYYTTSGLPGGNIGISDFAPPSTIYFFSAPATYLGDQAWRYGQGLRWDHRYTFTDAPVAPNLTLPDVVLIGTNFGTNFVVVGDAGEPATRTNVWAPFKISLTEASGWHVDNMTNRAPTEAEFRSVLAGLRFIYVNGEYIPNNDTGYLDNFEMGPEYTTPFTTAIISLDVCWSTVTNQVYQLESGEPLGAGDWIALGPPIPGTGGRVCVTIDPATAARNFYRVVLPGSE